MREINEVGNVRLTREEARTIDKAIRLLRDRHFRNHFNAKDIYSDSAQRQRALAEDLDELRNRITTEVRESTYTVVDRVMEELA